MLFLAVATSTGCIEIWEGDQDEIVGDGHTGLRRVKTVNVVSERPEILVMKLAAHPNERFRNIFAAALSDGTCVFVNIDNEEDAVSTCSTCHSFQVWEVVWVPTVGKDDHDNIEIQSRLIMSGADDAAIKFSIIEEEFEGWDTSLQQTSSYLSDTRTHESGE